MLQRGAPPTYLRLTTGMGSSMTAEKKSRGKRVLLIEDEMMIRMLLQDMLADLGHTLAAEAGRLDEAVALAKEGDFDLAILDVNLNGQPILPVVDILVERGVPFVFATGYGQRGVPEPYRQTPTLQKPFQVEALAHAIEVAAADRY
jgi:CheY-like chemotaxis protein